MKLKEGENNYKKSMLKNLRMKRKFNHFKKMDKFLEHNKSKNKKEKLSEIK